MKKKLDNKIRKFATAEKEAPVSAPKASFLTSGLSGIFEQMNQSPAATPSRSETEKTNDEKPGGEGNENEAEEKPVDPSIDHVEVSDMDLDSESENEGDSSVATPAHTDTNTSAVSTPKQEPSAKDTPSPSVTTPSTTSALPTPQYGYTMTVNSTDENETSSPASHTSAPSPDGSPELNLEIYEGPPAGNTLADNELGVMTNQTFLGGVSEQKLPSSNPGSKTTNYLKKQGDAGVVEAADSSGQGTTVSNEINSRPLVNLLGDLLRPLVHTPQGKVNQSEEQITSVQQEPTDTENQVDSKLTDVGEASSTDEEGAGGDNTPEHGLDFAEAPPIFIRADTSFPRPPIPPSFPGPAQVFQNRPPLGRPPFVSPERMPRFPNELDMFMRDGPRRASIEEQLEHQLRSPGIRSPRMHGPPMEWERGPPFAPRPNVQPVRESRDPRLRRREMMGRPGEGGPFIDRVPPLEMRGRPPGMGHLGDGVFMERQGHHPVDMRDEREQMIRRRPSLGNEMDGPRERHIWEMGEGHPPMEMRPELHGDMRDGPFPFERHQRGVEIRERFHPMERDLDRREGPHPIELRDAPPPHMRGDMNHSIDSRHPMDRTDLFDGAHSIEHHNEFHPGTQGAVGEVPTSEEESTNLEEPGNKSVVGVLPQEQNPGNVFHEGGEEHQPLPEGPQTNNPVDQSDPQDQVFHPGVRPQIRPPVERTVFDTRPEFHADNLGPVFGPPGQDYRPIRPVGGPFGPRHEGRGRFSGPRNFHSNFRPRNFRPRHEGGRPRFPMHGGPRLKRPGLPFHPDHAKRPHY